MAKRSTKKSCKGKMVSKKSVRSKSKKAKKTMKRKHQKGGEDNNNIFGNITYGVNMEKIAERRKQQEANRAKRKAEKETRETAGLATKTEEKRNAVRAEFAKKKKEEELAKLEKEVSEYMKKIKIIKKDGIGKPITTKLKGTKKGPKYDATKESLIRDYNSIGYRYDTLEVEPSEEYKKLGLMISVLQ